jgi:hypothetical protein
MILTIKVWPKIVPTTQGKLVALLPPKSTTLVYGLNG